MDKMLLEKVEELINNMEKFQEKLYYIDSIRDDSDKIREMKDIVIDKAEDFWDRFNKHSKYLEDYFYNNNIKFNDIEKNILDLKNDFNNLLNAKIEELNNNINTKAEEANRKTDTVNNSLKEELNIFRDNLSNSDNLLNAKIEELNNNINIKIDDINKNTDDNISKLNKKLLFISIFSPIFSIIIMIIIIKMNIFQ